MFFLKAYESFGFCWASVDSTVLAIRPIDAKRSDKVNSFGGCRFDAAFEFVWVNNWSTCVDWVLANSRVLLVLLLFGLFRRLMVFVDERRVVFVGEFWVCRRSIARVSVSKWNDVVSFLVFRKISSSELTSSFFFFAKLDRRFSLWNERNKVRATNFDFLKEILLVE